MREHSDETKSLKPGVGNMTMPKFLYHAAPKKYAEIIAKSGLEPRSGGKDEEKYLSMSGKESGACTTERRANDVIFRVKCSNLMVSKWNKKGAGEDEWRGTQKISSAHLDYRRFLKKTDTKKIWRSAKKYPAEM